MYKVFIADDNQLSRKALVTVVSWERYRCTVVGEADNGTDALEQIRLLRPDIVLLDIRMPGLTGLEVVRELKKEQPDCICIMITAYDDFLLIQQGVKLGVFDYILKPVVSAEMEDVMKRAVEEIGRREARTSELEELRTSIRQYCSEIEEHSSEIMRKLFNDGINGYVESVRKLKEMLLERGIFHDYELMLIVPGEKDRQMLDSWVRKERRIFESCSRQFRAGLLDCWRNEGMVVLILFRDIMLVKEYHLTALKIGQKLLSENVEGSINISISSVSRNLSDLPELFRQTVFCHNCRFFLENREILHYESLRSKSVQQEYKQMVQLDEFYSACRERPGQMLLSLKSFLKQLPDGVGYDMEYVKNILIQTAVMMTYLVKESGCLCPQMKEMNEITQEVEASRTIQEAFQWMEAYTEELQKQCELRSQNSHQTRKILDYLNRHYAEHITLPDLSDYMKLSSTHICRILKQDTGETFVTLLNKIRIMEAIRLLKKGNLKIYEVAEAVGFSNYAYFYQMFKKETGSSPRDYQ